MNNRSRAALENIRVEHNTRYGIHVKDMSRVAISNSEVRATGFRLNPDTGDFPTTSNPRPGDGIEFQNRTSGTVCQTSVTGNFRDGIDANRNVSLALVNVFDNDPNLRGVRNNNIGTSCIGDYNNGCR